DAATRNQHAGGRLQGDMGDDILTRRNAAENAAGVIRRETLRRQLIAMFAALLRDRREAGADLDTFDGVDTHQRVGNFGVKAIENRLAEAGLHAAGDDGDFRADRITFLAQFFHVGLHRFDLVSIGAEEGIGFDNVPINIAPVDFFYFDRAELRQIAAHFDTQLFTQPFFGDGTGGDTHRGFARRRTAATAIIAGAVFVLVGVVGVH